MNLNNFHVKYRKIVNTLIKNTKTSIQITNIFNTSANFMQLPDNFPVQGYHLHVKNNNSIGTKNDTRHLKLPYTTKHTNTQHKHHIPIKNDKKLQF